ncbi:MAG TPA: HAMP domain-containing histidine kinase [Dehalococcoidia bacterium]|nr:HAMP domain-containing histidine kinase [Dehalococcoidia bacterium]
MSFRTRLFATYALIVVICLGLVALLVTVLLQGYRDRLTMERLDNMARPIYVQVRSLVLGNVTSRQLWANLEEQAQKNKVYIIMASSDGNIVRQITPGQPPYRQPIAVPPGGLPQDILEPTQGRFENTEGRTYIFAAYPLGTLATSEKVPIDTLILTVPQTGSVAILASLFRPFLLAGIAALVISLILAFLFARSVYRPLKQVTGAARRIARGEYDQKIPVTSPREFGELAASFNDMAEKVDQSQQQLRHFVADVSHELKSPITAIQGFAQALVDGTAGDENTRLKAARIINDESKRMKRQVDELLELARMQSGQLKVNHEPVNLSELLEHCHELFSIQAQEKGIRLETAAESPVTVVGDIDRLEQLFSNLLDNAIKNSPAGSEVRLTASRSAGGYTEVRVADSGPGIPPEQIPYVFERFYQVTGVRTGVGLGLAIAREIVWAHGGTIEVRSEPGEGAEFMVKLPVAGPENRP